MALNKAGQWAACLLLTIALSAKLSASNAGPYALVGDLFDLDNNYAFGNLNLISGVFTPIDEDLLAPGSLTILSSLGVYNGTIYTSDTSSDGTIYTLNTGALVPLGTNSGIYWAAITSTTSGLYGIGSTNVSGTNDELYSINPSTGHATPIAPLGQDIGFDFSVSTNSTSLFLTIMDTLYKINVTTGALTTVGGTTGVDLTASVLVSGTLYAVDVNGNVDTVNTSSGATTTGVLTSGGNYYEMGYLGLAPTASEETDTPEPSAWILTASGAILFALLRRTRLRSA